jgi:autoinducer 2-degrading protein
VQNFVVIVDFRVRPGALAAFRRLIDENACSSAQTEPGCRRFDVLVPSGETDRVVLYEIYDDRAAFAAHVASAHFAKFQAESGELVSTKSVFEYDLVCEGSAERAV